MAHALLVSSTLLALGSTLDCAWASQDAGQDRWPALYAQRGTGRVIRLGGPRTEQALHDALGWLAAHQDPTGRWDADGFMRHDPEHDRCPGAGEADRDVEVTALAMLAFLGDGHTTRVGHWRREVALAAEWLVSRQDAESGQLGAPQAQPLATLALAELAALDQDPRITGAARAAAAHLLAERRATRLWHRDIEGQLVEDVALSAWALAALRAATVAQLGVTREAVLHASSEVVGRVNDATDPGTGLVDPDALDPQVARGRATDEAVPDLRGCALRSATAAAIYIRLESGEEPRHSATVKLHDQAILRTVGARPWSLDTLDAEAWCLASQAYARLGGERWVVWRQGMYGTLVATQRRDGAAKGSWDVPVAEEGASHRDGLGRVGRTALLALSLEAHRAGR